MMEIETHRTAIKRKTVSRPMMDLVKRGHIDQTTRHLLDYGCGHGTDVTWLKRRGIHCVDGFDPHAPFGYQHRPDNVYDVVTMIYVVNVIPDPAERQRTIYEAWKRVAPRGFLFVASRTQEEVGKLAAKHGWARHSDGYVTAKKTFQKGHTVFGLLAFIRAIRSVKRDLTEWRILEKGKYTGVLLAKRRWPKELDYDG